MMSQQQHGYHTASSSFKALARHGRDSDTVPARRFAPQVLFHRHVSSACNPFPAPSRIFCFLHRKHALQNTSQNSARPRRLTKTLLPVSRNLYFFFSRYSSGTAWAPKWILYQPGGRFRVSATPHFSSSSNSAVSALCLRLWSRVGA